MQRKAACSGRAALALAALACVLAFALCGCGASQPSSAQSSGESTQSSSQSEATTTVEDEFRNADIGCGWDVKRSMELHSAQRFSVDYFDDGFSLLCLADGARYLVVPKGAKAPDGLADDVVVLQQPLDNIYLAASDTMCLIDALGQLEHISVSGIKLEDWFIESAVKAMEEGGMVYGGKYNMPDYELITSKRCPLAIESTMINHAPDVKEKLQDLGVNVFTELSSYEPEPLGRAEWVKVYGVLFGCEEKAQELFDAQAAKVEASKGESTGKTVAFFYINANGAAVVRKPGDYVTKMIAQAGGTYVFDELDASGSQGSTVTLEMERFYETAKDADVIIYNGTIDASVNTLDELVAKNELLAGFKAVKSGDVWSTEQNMYQQMIDTGSIIADFHEALTSADESKLEYLHRLR